MDAVLHAAGVGFGFVYMHPLQDGNGRLHRRLIKVPARLPNRRHRKEFEALEDDELADLEAIVVDTFELDDPTPGEPGARR